MVFPQLRKPRAQSQLGTVSQPRTIHGVEEINKDFNTFTLFQTTLSNSNNMHMFEVHFTRHKWDLCSTKLLLCYTSECAQTFE